jgi:abhydrolase domain-containing protein 15
VVFNKRGHGGSKLSTPKVQSFGDPEDFHKVVEHVRSKYPNATITALGSSAGSGLLASYLGEYGSDCILSYAVFVSPGYDAEFLFKNCIKHPYDFLLMSMLKKLLNNNRDMLAKAVDMDKVMKAKNMITLEEDLYCALYGYPSMDEYWKNNNPVRNASNISIPVLTISSLDDPVCTKECIDYSLFKHTIGESMLLTTFQGGHCGFLEGWNLEHWADKLAIDYLDACLEYKACSGNE